MREQSSSDTDRTQTTTDRDKDTDKDTYKVETGYGRTETGQRQDRDRTETGQRQDRDRMTRDRTDRERAACCYPSGSAQVTRGDLEV